MDTIDNKNSIFSDIELELNREWIYGSELDEPIGERNFVIGLEYFKSIFPELFPERTDIDEFLKIYVPEEDGEKIYQRALRDNALIDETLNIYELSGPELTE